jgi:glyoxylase-like metal-dependent hydrolase (beta-lactamase superfamily II)
MTPTPTNGPGAPEAAKVLTIPTGDLGTNTYFVTLGEAATGETPVIVVDPGDDGDLIVSFLRGRRLRPLAVALTHSHYDHILGLGALAKAFPGLHIGEYAAGAPSFGPNMLPSVLKQYEAPWLRPLLESIQALPGADVFFEEGSTLDCLLSTDATDALEAAARSWRVLHTPGHSTGSCCFHHPGAGLLISGDTLFWGTWGRTDLPGGSDREMEKSLRRLYELPGDTAIYPGHERYGFALKANRLGQ